MTDNAINYLMELTLKNEKDIDEHLMTLFALTLSLKPSIIFELGVRTARSTFPFLLASQYTSTKIVSVDIQDILFDFNFPKEWLNNWQFFKKDAISFLEEEYPKFVEKYDLLKDNGKIIYIDDWHSGEHVKKELELVSKFVDPKDLIILHDLMYGNTQPNYHSVKNPEDKQWGNGGPYAAIEKIDLNKWEYVTIPRCHGLTLLRKKSEIIINE